MEMNKRIRKILFMQKVDRNPSVSKKLGIRFISNTYQKKEGKQNGTRVQR